MKKGFRVLGIVALVLGAVLFVKAQTGQGKFAKHMDEHRMGGDRFEHAGMKGLDLSDEQQKQMKSLHISFMKDTKSAKNMLNEKRARLNTLTSADKADMNAINKIVDEMAGLKASITKRRLANMQEVRGLLTDEQRVLFDAHRSEMGGKRNHDFGSGKRHGHRGFGEKN